MANDNRWTRFRHKLVVKLLRATFGIYVRLKYHITIEPFPDSDKRPYLILMNHQTAYDQFFVGVTFHQPVYYMASEDLFSMGWVSDLIRWLVAPIPIRKQTTDLQAVKNCIRVAREGGSICIAPEGNRTYHGRTVYIKPAIASLAKKLGLPIAIFRIEGGYGIHPRWSDVIRKGKMRCYVSRVIEPEEYADMSREDLDALLIRELTVDEACLSGTFHHKKNAEFLERVFYVCPKCGLAPFESKNDTVRCTKCGLSVRHLPTKELEGITDTFPHRFVADWYDWQNDYIRGAALPDGPLFEDRVQLRQVFACKNKKLLDKDTSVTLYRDKLQLGDRLLPFEALSAVTVLGKNKLNIYMGDQILQLKGSKRFNALKYVNLFHKHLNESAGKTNGQFLGI